MRKGDREMKVLGLIVILMFVTSVFGSLVSAENVSDIVENNMVSQNISVRTFADIWVEPESYNFTVKRGNTECENLTIGNNGTGILIFNITTQARAPTTTMYPLPINYGDTKIIVEQEFKKPEIRKVKKDKKEYDRVTILGLSKIVKAGEPVLPVKSMQILLPFGKDVQSIKVTGMKRDLVGTYYVEPGEEPVPIGIPLKEPPKVLQNKAIYSSTEPYPGLYEASVQNLRGYKILNLNLYPVRYTPKPGTITHYTEMKVTINTKPDVNNLYRGLSEDKERVLQVVDNPEIAHTYPINTKFSPSYDHVIITNSTFATAFQELADWKSRKGVRSHVVTVEYINSTHPGRDLQEKIRNYINYSYLNDGIEYVLLGGDGDGSPVGGETGPAVVPARGFYAYAGGYTDYNIPADLYYAGLDGTWDDDNDDIWGEPGEDDLYAEVFVGRAAVDSLAEVENFISKTIAYEGIADDPYLKNATMVGENLGWAVWGKDYKEEIRNGSCNWSYCTVGFPQEYNVSTLYDRDYSWPKSVLIAIMNSGTQLIFNHLGHANVGYVMKMYNSDVDSLVNNKYFFAYSQGCYDGSFDNRGIDGSYYTYDCICEHFTITPHGAFAFIGNSRYGWGSGSTTNGPSQHYDRQFYDAIFNESMGNIGKANQDSKEDNVWQIGGSAMRWCYYEINLFGDPETSLVPTAVPWLSVTPDNGTVSAGNYTNVSVCVNATYLEERNYTASIIIRNNDPDENPVTIPVNLTVIPPDHDIAVSNLSMPDEVEVNTNISVTATVCNRGSNDETDIVVDFIVDGIIEDNTTIPSLTSVNCMNVSFNWMAPSVEGEHNLMVRAEPVVGETILWNNMMSKNISVVTRPDIWVAPHSFNETLHRGDIIEKNLTIGNNGTGVLEFNISGGDTAENYSITSIPYEWVEGVSGGTNLGLSDDSYSTQTLPFTFTFYGVDYNTIHICSNGWASFTYASSFIPGNMTLPVTGWNNTMFVIGDDWKPSGSNNVYVKSITSPNRYVITWYNVPHYGTGGSNTFQIVLYETGEIKFNYNNVENPNTFTVGLNKGDGTHGTNYGFIPASNSSLLFTQGYSWLSVAPTNGTVSPSNCTNITVTFNASELPEDEYNATINITNNDPDKNPVLVPVNLTVIPPEHDIAISNLSAPDVVELNEKVTVNGTVCNLGLNDEVDIIIDFIVDGIIEDSGTISSLTSRSCTNVSFLWPAPGVEGEHNISIYAEPVAGENITWNNMKAQNVTVKGIPDIWVEPKEFNLTLEKGEVTNETLTIGNNGTGILNASLSASSSTDIDQDNEREIIVRHYSSGYTYVVNNSNLDTYNGWEWRSPYTDSYKGFAIADVNSDGIPNLLEGGYNYLRVYDVKNKRTLYSSLYTGGSYGGTAAGDIDNDGVVEMLVSDYDGYIYVYDGTTGMPDAQGHITTPTAYYGTGLGIGDIDNDGVVEVVRADYYGIDIFNGETRALEKAIPVSYIRDYPDLVLGDANTNGIAEMYVGGYYGYVYAYEWDGTTATQLWRSFDLGSNTRPCGFANADNDGDFEVFVGASNGYIYALDASTGIVEGSAYTGYSSYTACAVGDIDGDGDLEIVTGNYDGYIRTYTYDSGTFTLEKTSVTDYGSYLGYMTDSIIISGARDPRVFNLINYIQFNESAVSVPPNSSHNVTVTFNATTLNKGTYNATIVIDNNDPDENPVLIPVNLTVITPPHIISYSPINLTLTKYIGNISTFIVTTDQVMTSNSWFILPEGITTLGNGTSSLTVIWSGSGVYNVTYVGTNENGSVNITWIVTVLEPPTIVDWYNDKTKDNSTSVTIDISEGIYFNASANQSIATWNWFKNGINQNNSYENFSTSWSEEGEYIVSVNASNVNGTSNTVIWNVTVELIPSIEVNKTVWNPVSWTWEKSIEANVNDIVRFKCIIHNNGDYNLTNITAIDKLSEGLEYAYNATPPEHWISPDNRTIKWLFEGPIAPCENITIEFDAHVVKSGTNTNTYNATAWCEETGPWVYNEDSAIVITPPPTPFMIYGWIYRNGDPVNNPNVNITNLNTTEVFTAKTNESYNYYQVLTDSNHVSTDNVLHFYASDNGNATEFNHTVTQDEMDNGGFEQNITIPLPSPEKPDLIITEKWVCWPDNCTICYNLTNTGNGTALAGHNTTLYVDGGEEAHDHVPVDLAPNESYTGCFDDYTWTYTPPSDNITVCADNNETVDESNETNNCLTNIWKCGDVNKDGRVTMSDVRKVYNRYLDPSYSLCNEWAGDVNCDGRITMSDVRKVYNRYLGPSYDLNCCCE